MQPENHPADPADRLEQAVGRAIRRLSRTLEQVGDEPLAREDLVRAVGFAAKAPDDSPTRAGEELGAMLRRVLDAMATRLRARSVEIPDLTGTGVEIASPDA